MSSNIIDQHDSDTGERTSDSGTAPLREIEAMSKVAAALVEVDREAAARILRWASERFGGTSSMLGPAPHGSRVSAPAPPSGDELADLFARANPADGPERALVVGYWLQVIQGHEDLEGQMVNRELKHLGHQLSNVTATMSLLINQQPSLVIQTRKIGSTKQGRKRYRITTSGINKVRQMLSAG